MAWSMIEYNAYFGRLLAGVGEAAAVGAAARPSAGEGLLRVQREPRKAAAYERMFTYYYSTRA